MQKGKIIKDLREKQGISQVDLAEKIGVSKQTLYKYENGIVTNIPSDKIESIAKVLGTDPQTIMGWEEKSNIGAVFTDHIRMVPVYESVSAGFGTYADDCIVDYLPLRIVSDYEYEDTIGIRVSGDSMYPKIEDGDIIQVHKQDSVDSGDVAVMLIDGCEGVVKKVVYGKTWVELHSSNPMYPVRLFKDEELLRLRVVGKVKKVIKDI